ncbi:MAG: hypothetical protein ABSG15_14005, partial [FCB group bacterium]
MKKFIFFTLFFILYFSYFTYSQYYWEKIPGLYGGKVKQITFDNKGNIFACTEKHIYISTDEGEKWKRIGGPKEIYGNPFPDIYSFFSLGKYIYTTAAIQGIDNGTYITFKSSDNGIHWFECENIPETWFHYCINKEIGLFALSIWDKSILIINGKTGKTITLCDKTVYLPEEMQFLDNGKLLFRTEKYIEKSRTNNYYLEIIDPDSCSHQEIDLGLDYFRLLHETINKKIYFSSKEGLYVLNDDNKSYQQILKMERAPIYVTSSPDGQNIYVVNNTNTIYYSEDFGKNWKELNTSFNKISVVEYFKDNIIFAITEAGVAKYKNSEWHIVNDGIDEVQVNTINFDKDNNLYAGTSGFGVLKKEMGSNEWITIYNGLTDYLKYKPNTIL